MIILGFELSLGAGEGPEEPGRANSGGSEEIRSERFAERRADSLESDGHCFF